MALAGGLENSAA